MARLSVAVGMLLVLVLSLVLTTESRTHRGTLHRRQKREWISPPAKLKENTDYTNLTFIAKIRSDHEEHDSVEYFLSGPGADKPPVDLFRVNPQNGYVTITGMLDREKHACYNLTGSARYRNGTPAEEDIPLTVYVLDLNDNTPYFELQRGNIAEASKPGAYVMHMIGKDDDQEGTINSEISYSIVSQEPAGAEEMFSINAKTGELTVKQPTLDREIHDTYKLVVQGADLGGRPGGLSGTGTVEINILDINDNVPTLEKSEYTGSVDENVADVTVMRIKALDKDLEPTPNWLAVFSITKGNEDKLFSIETDKATNEGILKLVKAVDFEEVQNLELGLQIINEAPFYKGDAIEMDVDVKVGEGGAAGGLAGAGIGTGVDLGGDLGGDLGLDLGLDAGLEAGLKPGIGLGPGVGLKPRVTPKQPRTELKPDAPGKSYPIKIAVNNLPEGPAFKPTMKNIHVPEDPKDIPKDGVITTFAAIDPDTGDTAKDVSYAKAYDPDNWIIVDDETAEIKFNKFPDRESPFLVNGTYIAKILAISQDTSYKTATGTLAIQVIDYNDHCPTLTTDNSNLCSDEKTVYVTAFDEDMYPNADPFTFRIIPDGTTGSWEVEIINATTAAFHSNEALWPGLYKLQVEVADAQGLFCPANEEFAIHVCTCERARSCEPFSRIRDKKATTEFSAPAIGLMFCALCLLLFIPLLLLFCQCGGKSSFPDQFNDLPFDTKEHLISYHTEGKGEDKEVPLQCIPVLLGAQKKVEGANVNSKQSKIIDTRETATLYGVSVQKFNENNQSLLDVDNATGFTRDTFSHGTGSTTFMRNSFGIHNMSKTALYEDIALPDVFLDDYFSQKAAFGGPVKDSLLMYDYDGQGSPAGSLGCCSLVDPDDDLHFLNDLGPKFKTLAEICSPPSLPTLQPSLTLNTGSSVKATTGTVETVVKARNERIIDTKQTDVIRDNVVSPANISKSLVTKISSNSSTMTLPHSKVTNISQSSKISHSATLPRPPQTVLLQQQPLYYTTNTAIQPMHYVVQPQLQNTVVLADAAYGANVQGLYVVSGQSSTSGGLVVNGNQISPTGLAVSGLHSPTSGLLVSGTQSSPLLFQGIESPRSPTSTSSPTSPVSPILFLPGSPGMSQGSIPADGWKIVGPNPGGNYILVKDKRSPSEPKGSNPGSPQGTLPRGAILIKEAAPPQGVLGLAAQGSVYGILPGHIVSNKGNIVAVNNNLGQTWVGQTGYRSFEPVNVLGLGVGQPQIEHLMTVNPEVRHGVRHGSVSQVQVIPPLQQINKNSSVSRRCRIDHPRKDRSTDVVNAFTTSETNKTSLPSKKGVIKAESNITEKLLQHKSEDQFAEVFTSTAVQEASPHDADIQSVFKDSGTTVLNKLDDPKQAPEKSLVVKGDEANLKSFAASDVPLTIFDQSNIPGDTNNESGSQTPANGFTYMKAQTKQGNDPPEKAEEAATLQSKQHGDHLPSECFTNKEISTVTQTSSKESFLLENNFTELINREKGKEESSVSSQEDSETLSLEQAKITGSKIEENDKEEQRIQQSIGDHAENRCFEVESGLQSNEFTEDQSVSEQEEKVRPTQQCTAEKNLDIAVPDYIHTDDKKKKTATFTEEAKAEQGQSSKAIVKVNTVRDELSGTSPKQSTTDNVYTCKKRTGLDEEAIQEVWVDHNVQDKLKTNQTDADEKPSLQATPVRTVAAILEEGQWDENMLSASEKNTLHESATEKGKNSDLQATSTAEQTDTAAESSCDLSAKDQDQLDVDPDQSIVSDDERPDSMQDSSLFDDQDEEIQREDALSTSSQFEDNFISDDSISNGDIEKDTVTEMVPSIKQSVTQSDDNVEEIEMETSPSPGTQHSSSKRSDENINKDIVEDVGLSVQQNNIFSDDRNGDIKIEGTSREDSQLEDPDVNISNGKKEGITGEEAAPPTHEHITFSDDQDEDVEREAASGSGSQIEDSDVNISDGEKEDTTGEVLSPTHEHITFIDDRDEDIERDVASGSSSQIEDSHVNISDGEKEDTTGEVLPPTHEHITFADDLDENVEREGASGADSQIEDLDVNISDREKENQDNPGQEVPALTHEHITFIDDRDENVKTEDASGAHCHLEDPDVNISDRENEDITGKEASPPTHEHIAFSDGQDESVEREDASTADSQLEDPNVNMSNGEKEDIIREGVAPPTHENIAFSDDQDEDVERGNASGADSQIEDLDVNISDREKENEDITGQEVPPPTHENITFIDDRDENVETEDASGAHCHLEDPDVNISDREKKDITRKEVSPPTHEHIAFSDGQDESVEREDASTADSQIEDLDVNTSNGEKEDIIGEEVSTPAHKHITSKDDKDQEVEREDASGIDSQIEDLDVNISDGENEKTDITGEKAPPIHEHITFIGDQNANIEKENASGVQCHLEDPDVNVSDGEKEDIIGEEVAPPTHDHVTFSYDKNEAVAKEDKSQTGSQMKDQLNNIDDTMKDDDTMEKAESSLQQNTFSDDHETASEMAQFEGQITSDHVDNGVTKVALSTQQHLVISEDTDEEFERQATSETGSHLDDQLTSGDRDDTAQEEDNVVKVTLPVQENIILSDKNDLTGTDSQFENQSSFDSTEEAKEKDIVENISSPIQQHSSISGEGEDSGKQDPSGMTYKLKEEFVKPYAITTEEDSCSVKTEPAKDPLLPVPSTKRKQVGENESECQEKPLPPVSIAHQVSQGSTPDAAGIQAQESVRSANRKHLDGMVTTSEEVKASNVATGQVLLFNENKEAIGIQPATSGQESEGGIIHFGNQNTKVTNVKNTTNIKNEDGSDRGELTLGTGKEELSFDQDISGELDNVSTATGQVSLVSLSDVELVEETVSSVLEADPGSAETEPVSFTEVSEGSKRSNYPEYIRDESTVISGGAAGVDPHASTQSDTTDVVSQPAGHIHETEAPSSPVNPMQLQEVISQTPHNKSRKSKKRSSSSSSPSPKSPSGKCKQQ